MPEVTIRVYKIPSPVVMPNAEGILTEYSILEIVEIMRGFVGLEGSRLNPIEDALGNWIVSQEEWNADEFQFLKTEWEAVVGDFELIDFVPKPAEEI